MVKQNYLELVHLFNLFLSSPFQDLFDHHSKLLIREQKSCTIWNICEEDSFIKIFHCFFHKEGRK